MSAFILIISSAYGQDSQEEIPIVVIARGHNYVEFQKTESVDRDYRVMGRSTLDKGDNSLNHVTTILPLVPLDEAREIWKQDNCERRAFQASIKTAIIITDPKVENKFSSYLAKQNQYKQFALHIKGVTLQKIRHLFSGHEVPAQGEIEDMSLLVEDVEIVNW